MGGVTVGYQTEVDIGGVGAADEEATHMGVSFAVNDDLTVSYGVQEVDITGKVKTRKTLDLVLLTLWVL